jgi:hypothetical protein
MRSAEDNGVAASDPKSPVPLTLSDPAPRPIANTKPFQDVASERKRHPDKSRRPELGEERFGPGDGRDDALTDEE